MSEKSIYQEGEKKSFLDKVGIVLTAGNFLLAVKSLSLPVLVAAFPPLFYYGNNATIVPLLSLTRSLFLYCGISVISYLIFLFLKKGQYYQAANASFICMIFFNIYGALFNYLLHIDIFAVEDYTLFPLFFLLAIYAAWFASKIKPTGFWKIAVFMIGVMSVINIVKIVPMEIGKIKKNQVQQAAEVSVSVPVSTSELDENAPDIYFFLFDEFASFSTARSYWNYHDVDDFVDFLSSKGFYVAEESQGNSIDTLHLTAQRLNYKIFDLASESADTFFEAISHNRAMSYLKEKGYTTVVFSEINFGYPTMPEFEADYIYTYGSSNVTNNGVDTGLLFDDFGMMLAQNTMLRLLNLPSKDTLDSMFLNHQEMVFFTQERVTNLSDIPSPKFVYVHLLLPHYPFMFRENSSLIHPQGFYNWNNYLENYKFTINYAEKIVNDLLEKADPERPPVIILQSDHGPRNIVVEYRGGVPLENFPEEYKTRILNAMYLPGCDTSDLSQQMNPINTFPIVFNCYFQADIPLQ